MYGKLCEFAKVIDFKREKQKKRKDQLPSCVKDAFASEVKSEEEASHILSFLIEHQSEIPLDISPVELSRYALKEITGYAPLDGKDTRNVPEIYKTLLSVSESIGKITDTVQIGPECWSRKYLERTMDVLFSIKTLRDLMGDEWKGEEFRIDLGNICVLETELQNSVAKEFSKRVGLEEETVAETLSKLSRKWGKDLSPLYILAGRFNAQEMWHSELPVLREIIKEVLNGSFNAFKYDTPEAREQLSMLNSEQEVVWRENPLSVRYVSTEEVPDLCPEERIRNALNIVDSNLISHAQAHGWSYVEERVEEETREEIAKHLGKIAKSARAPVLLSSIRGALTDGNSDLAVSLCSYFIGNADRFTNDKQIKEDLKSVKQALLPPKDGSTNANLIFSCITDDPKLLLTVGDLVATASCQNYRIGSYIETLPGYVIDANIKTALAFVVPSSVLNEHPQIHECLRDKPKELDIKFNPGTLTLTLSQNGSAEKLQIALGKAHRRQILRLGRNDYNEASLLVERAYIQNHSIEQKIETALESLINGFEESAGILPARGNVSFPASRNPGGVYSDAGGGVRHGVFKISL